MLQCSRAVGTYCVDSCKSLIISPACDNTAHGRQVVQQATGGPVWGVHRAQEAPGLGHELAYGGGAKLCKVGAPVNGPEMG